MVKIEFDKILQGEYVIKDDNDIFPIKFDNFSPRIRIFNSDIQHLSDVSWIPESNITQIFKNGKKYIIKENQLGPDIIKYNGRIYKIYKNIQCVTITANSEIIATGKCSVRGVEFTKYNTEIKDIIKEIAVAFFLKIVWSDPVLVSVVIGRDRETPRGKEGRDYA